VKTLGKAVLGIWFIRPSGGEKDSKSKDKGQKYQGSFFHL